MALRSPHASGWKRHDLLPSNMKVSVLVVTYNQEAYIAEAIQSVLRQAVDFDYEIVIGEDNSSDRTREIVSDFAKKHPEKISVLLQDLADSEGDRARGIGGKTNFLECLKACRGQYVAFLDGDDYWTYVHKLQRQVDFLDQHPDFAISCHNVRMLYEDETKEPVNLIPPGYREVSTIEDLFSVNFIPTCSAVFRRGLFNELPDWFFTLKVGDWPIHIMNAQYGKIGYINEVMAHYRVHNAGVWSATSPIDQRREIIKMMDHLDGYLGFKYRKHIRAAKGGFNYEIAQIYYAQGDIALGRKYLVRYFWYSGFQERRNLVSLFLQLHVPVVYKSLRTLRDFARSLTTA